MQTKIRVIEKINSAEYYKHITIAILEQGKYDLQTIGWVSWQGDKDRDYWYAFEFTAKGTEPEHFMKIAKLAKYVKEMGDDGIQPEEFINLIGGVRHILYQGDYIPESFKGMRYYRVEKDGEFYEKIFAATEKQALAKFNKKYNSNYTLTFKELVNF